ncbi:putative holin-like toxin [Streptococcus suis]|uniref:putative holin-like toxin n=1 Tax=Streptococcus parasuis TaxID=1501662 RepID=UPI0023794C9D|nr:putative holin-like toxin [Streptococcus parasuis]WDN58717.1 putative holin-like toxin [Streptococcus parasuis]WDN60567.1 putative holin-like toxin [Streptococcus parasuis]
MGCGSDSQVFVDIIGYPTTKKFAVSTFEVVQKILAFASFIIALVSLCYKIFKENDQKK